MKNSTERKTETQPDMSQPAGRAPTGSSAKADDWHATAMDCDQWVLDQLRQARGLK